MAGDIFPTPAISAKRPSVGCAKGCDTRSDHGTWRFNQGSSLERYLLLKRFGAQGLCISPRGIDFVLRYSDCCAVATGRNVCSFAVCDCNRHPFQFDDANEIHIRFVSTYVSEFFTTDVRDFLSGVISNQRGKRSSIPWIS